MKYDVSLMSDGFFAASTVNRTQARPRKRALTHRFERHVVVARVESRKVDAGEERMRRDLSAPIDFIFTGEQCSYSD